MLHKVKASFGVGPHFPVLVVLSYKFKFKSVCTKLRNDEDYLERILNIAHSNLEGLPWTWIQAGMLGQSWYEGEKPDVNAALLGFSLVLSVYTLHSSFSSAQTLANLMYEGSIRRFTEFLFRLGHGTGVVPLTILDDLLSERDVTVSEDLSWLDFRGLQCIGRALCSSPCLRSVTFENCRFSGLNEESWKEFTDLFGWNRHNLKHVTFIPAVETDDDSWWFFEDVLDLETVTNGEDKLFEQQPLQDALSQAARFGTYDSVQRALMDLDPTASGMETAMQCPQICHSAAKLAARLDNWSAVAAFLDSDHVDALDKAELLVWGGSEGADQVVQLLLEFKVDPTLYYTIGVWGGELIAAACQKKVPREARMNIIKLALEKRGDPNAKGAYGESALHWAGNCEFVPAVEMLIQARADVNLKDEQSGETALHWCCVDGSPGVAELLMQARADIESRSSSSMTPLMLACQNAALTTASKLLMAGADFKAETDDDCEEYPNHSVMMLAQKSGNQDMVEMMQAWMDQSSSQGKDSTPAHK